MHTITSPDGISHESLLTFDLQSECAKAREFVTNKGCNKAVLARIEYILKSTAFHTNPKEMLSTLKEINEKRGKPSLFENLALEYFRLHFVENRKIV